MSNKKVSKGLLILAGLGIVGTIGIAIGAAALAPSYKALSPMFEAANNGVTDGYETRFVASEAMLPTFEVNDRILIDKQAYKNASPARGDIILFQPTEALKKQGYNAPFIERVVGVPGETIEIKNGKVYINGEAIVEDYIFAPPEYTGALAKIPERSYYVLGDNRNNSYDSHYWGYVDEDLIIGKTISIYFPPSRAKKLD